MGAYIIDKNQLKFLFKIEKTKLNKSYPTLYTKEEVLNLHTQQINLQSWVDFILTEAY